MVVQSLGKEDGQTSTNAYVTELICYVGHHNSVVARVVNNHASNDVNWKVFGWRVFKIQKATRHPTSIPTTAETIQIEEAVGTAGASKEEAISDAKSFTHIGIQIKSVIADTHSDDVDFVIYGRFEPRV